jgi:hypothetical protein
MFYAIVRIVQNLKCSRYIHSKIILNAFQELLIKYRGNAYFLKHINTWWLGSLRKGY